MEKGKASLSGFKPSVSPSLPAELGVAEVSGLFVVWLGAGRMRKGHGLSGGSSFFLVPTPQPLVLQCVCHTGSPHWSPFAWV